MSRIAAGDRTIKNANDKILLSRPTHKSMIYALISGLRGAKTCVALFWFKCVGYGWIGNRRFSYGLKKVLLLWFEEKVVLECHDQID